MKNAFTLLLAIFCFAKSQSQSVTLTPLNPPNTLNWLIATAKAPGDNRLYAIQKDGFIRIVKPDGTVLSTPFLDLSAKVNNMAQNEQGLLGLAFHPNYQQNGLFYVFYNEIGTGKCTISRFLRSAFNPDQGNITSEGILLTFDHPGPNHVGGCMKFGSDGYLYVGTGDGGGAGDPNGNGQNLLSFMGKILRLQVGNGTYSVPADNPFVGVPNAAPEIWAYGLRNPWRFDFDPFTGDLWIGDVGQDAREEVNFQSSTSGGGEDYGWSCYEGTLPFNSNQCFAGSVYTDPLYEYPHQMGGDCSVTGGTVYRGTQFADLFGRYIFTDFCSGKIRSVLNDGIPTVGELGDFNDNDFTSLEAGPDGELYVTGFNDNIIYKVKSTNCAPVAWLVAEPDIMLPVGGSVQLNAYGNNMNYQWLLDGNPINGATSSSYTASVSGTYSVVVTNPVGGCSNTSNTVNLTVLVPLSVVLETTDVSCFGQANGVITAQAMGGVLPYGYVWSNGATTASIENLLAGEYTVTVSDTNGNSITATATLTQPSALTVNISTGPSSAFEAYVYTTVSGGTPPYFYFWHTGATTNSLLVPYGDPYSVTVTDANGCFSIIKDTLPPIIWDNADEMLQEIKLMVLPNPMSDKVQLSFNHSSTIRIGIQLRNFQGRQVLDLLPFGPLPAGEKTVQASTAALPPGVYFIVVNLDGKLAARKVVKR